MTMISKVFNVLAVLSLAVVAVEGRPLVRNIRSAHGTFLTHQSFVLRRVKVYR